MKMRYKTRLLKERSESELKAFFGNILNLKNRLCCITILMLFSISVSAQEQLRLQEFKSPSSSSKVHTWWHWMNNGITKEGITRDLESMFKQGIVQATILNVGLPIVNPVNVPNIYFDTPEWYDMFYWALEEANRLNIKIGIHNCDGWSTSGGPWVTPDESMKQYVWSKTVVEGGRSLSVDLPEPPSVINYYRDAAVVAYPITNSMNSFQSSKPSITINNGGEISNLSDANPLSSTVIKEGDILEISLDTEIDVSKIAFYSYIADAHAAWNWGPINDITSSYIIHYSKDGKQYNEIDTIDFIGVNETRFIELPKIKAKYFKLVCTKSPKNYPLSELEFLNEDEVSSFAPKIAFLLEKTQAKKSMNDSDFDLTPNNNLISFNKESVIDLTKKMDSLGHIEWKSPKGNWAILRFGYTTTAKKNQPSTVKGRGLEVNKMDTIHLNKHFKEFSQKLISKAGKFNGNTFKFLLIDSWEADYQSWTRNFPEEFKKRRGYDIIPWLPVLCGELVGDTKLSEGFLFDFQLTISDLVGDNYYKHFRDLCHRNDLEMHAEVIYGGNGNYPHIDVLKSNEYPDLVMTEFWARQDENQLIKYKPVDIVRPFLPQYTAFEKENKVIASEAYTGFAHYSESPFDLKPWGDQAYASGVNQMILHSYVHQPFERKPGVTLWQFGSHFNRHNPWWNYAEDWLSYQSRVQYMLQQGEPGVDIVYYIGDQLPQSFYKSIVNEVPYGYVAYPINFDMLVNKAKVVSGKISFGGVQKYALLALPDKSTMQLATLRKIEKLVRNGGVVYGPKPSELLSLNDVKNGTNEFKRLTDSLWGEDSSKYIDRKYGKGKVVWGESLDELLKNLKVNPTFDTDSSDPKDLLFIHKRVGTDDLYFVFNQQNKAMNRELLFRTKNNVPEIWNAENGLVTNPAIYIREGEQIRIPVTFEPNQSLIFVFKNGNRENHFTKVEVGENQVFPSLNRSEQLSVVPEVIIVNNEFEFRSLETKNYMFTDANEKILRKTLEEPTIFDINDFKGTIDFHPIYDEEISPVDISSLKSLTEFEDSSIKYFAGKATYTIHFKGTKETKNSRDDQYLNLGDLDAVAEVILNGKHLGYYWIPNSEIAIPNLIKSNNTLEITVATVVRNRLIGDYIQYGKVKNLFTTSTVDRFFDKDKLLKPSGLIGPIQIIKYSKDK